MLCLGRHWNARTYSYENVRSDIDGLPAPALPPQLAALAEAAARDAGFSITPDTCIVNWYTGSSRMGLHQDKDESPESIAAGAPVVSFSIGEDSEVPVRRPETPRPGHENAARIGRRIRFRRRITLALPRRHRTCPWYAPACLPFEGRLNLTFRKF